MYEEPGIATEHRARGYNFGRWPGAGPDTALHRGRFRREAVGYRGVGQASGSGIARGLMKLREALVPQTAKRNWREQWEARNPAIPGARRALSH